MDEKRHPLILSNYRNVKDVKYDMKIDYKLPAN